MKIKTLCALVLLSLSAAYISAQTITRCGGPTNALYINWPTFQFDVCHTGYNPYENRLSVSNVQNLVVAWQYTLSGSSSYPSSPAIVNGSVYFAANDGDVYALNATTGAYRRRRGANGVVYIVASFFDNDDNMFYSDLLALDASTGQLIWSAPVSGQISTFSPTVANGVVYVSGMNGGGLVMYNAATWSVNRPLFVSPCPGVRLRFLVWKGLLCKL